MPQSTNTVQIVESLAGVGAQVDAPAGVIKGVKLIGFESKNGRSYSPDVLRRAVTLYEGVKVNVDHPPPSDPNRPRRVSERMGVIKGARFVEGKGVFGDFHFNPKHALAEQVVWDAQNNPEAVGFSHNATLKFAPGTKGGKRSVEAIVGVRHLDLVADPATTRGIFESEHRADDEDADDDSHLNPTGRSRDVKDLPDSAFAFVEPGGKKDGQGRTTPRSKRLWPLHSSDSVRTALASIPKTKRLSDEQKSSALKRAHQAARRLKVRAAATTAKEEQESAMDLSTLTLEELQSARPDLLESVTEQQDGKAELEALQKKLKEFEAKEAKRKLASMGPSVVARKNRLLGSGVPHAQPRFNGAERRSSEEHRRLAPGRPPHRSFNGAERRSSEEPLFRLHHIVQQFALQWGRAS